MWLIKLGSNFVKKLIGGFCFVFFRARATNTHLGQEETSAFTYLEVYDEDGADVSPEIIVAPEDRTAVKGTAMAELHCIANARPLNELEMVWLKDGTPIGEAGVAFSFNDLWNRTLSLLQVDFAHEGTYSCRVQTRSGGPTITKEAKVTVVGESPHYDLKVVT